MRTTIFSIALAMGLPFSAAADPAMECSVANASQIEIGNCVQLAEDITNAAIKSALDFARQAAQELDSVTGRKASLPALSASQTSWESYRNQHCEFVGATFAGGSGTGIAIKSCRVSLGRQRIDELMKYSQ